MAKVLLVEPDKLLAGTYLKSFKTKDIAVHWEPSAQGAVTFLDANHPPLVILELQLASHNGVEFLYELRSQSDWQDIPVLLHTLVPLTELHLTETTKAQLGIVDYFYKPYTTLENLTTRVGQLLARNVKA